ncbi:M20/M25/M40 family metallo-hydrolase [Geomicrobium sp. JCM 19038]|uniref:M20/M25/M40 family metallo-hydrolase n=1 Tax=Geomicrobium sp. JCM 19038 TaxID=1460635 RepID=UPI00045F337C|nr:M20/M25/M40 family metallo-hydrolase [Geomicrobium sp. JCM 19038]GAK09260.1 aminopeptidase Y [Geomicrobium sp. JCM 19038]
MSRNKYIQKRSWLALGALLFATSSIQVASADEGSATLAPPTTGFEDRNQEHWSTFDEEINFLNELSESDLASYSEVGQTVEGRPIHLVRIGDQTLTDEEVAEGRNMLVVATQHGNEPAGREMALQFMRDLAFTDDEGILEQLEESTVLFVPTANPDGFIRDQRANANNVDMNRDHLVLQQPETRALAEVLDTYQPDLTVDAHERPRAYGNPDIEFLWPRNLNIDEDIRALSESLVEDVLIEDIAEQGFTTGIYGTPGGAGNGDERISRNMLGLRHGLGLLTETAGMQEPVKRVDAQMATIEATFDFYTEQFEEIGEAVQAAPEKRAQDGATGATPFYFDGADNWDPTIVQDPHYCGYLLHEQQVDELGHIVDAFSLETEKVSTYGTFVSMGQPMMTVIPKLMDSDALYNEVNALPLSSCEQPRVTASYLNDFVDILDEEGAFSTTAIHRALDLHTTTLAHFENRGQEDRLLEHTRGFQALLNRYQDQMTDEAYSMLYTFAYDLMDYYELVFDVDRAMGHISHLSETIGPRVAGGDAEREAAAYIEGEFERLGYETEQHLFDIRNGQAESQNVIAVKEADGVENPEIVYVTAHYDSVSVSPGANDNASGTAAIIELARVLEDVPSDKEVRFIAFGAEEIGLVGAREYVAQLSEEEIERSAANYNLDMIATNYEATSQMHITTVDGEENAVWDSSVHAAEVLGYDHNDYTLHRMGRSDHVPFHDAGIDAALYIWMEPGTPPGAARPEPWYHTPEDTIDRISRALAMGRRSH